ncbi:MAG TPA: hypothetical protein VFW19_03335 [Allosphingosinicella sp.]|nr:hypothetical protein [Allosphingosinicella sp.]
MNMSFRATILLAIGLCGAGADARDISPQSFIAGPMRAATNSVAVRVEVAQAEIKSNINPSNISVATRGGLLFAIADAAIDSARAKKAEVVITPVRNALTGFDVDALAIDTTRAEMADLSWISANAATFSKDTSRASQSAYLDTIPENELALITYSYDLSPDFSSIRVVEHISIAHKSNTNSAGGSIKPVDRLSERNLDYSQSVTSVVILAGAGPDKAANAALWAADGGRRARAALATAFAEVNRLTRKSLNLTPETIQAMNGKENKRVVANGYSGRLIPGEATGIALLWGPGFVSEQELADSVTK